jgi:hypothetical protein
MSFNGSGTFQINTAGQPVVAGTVITATAFNALTADLATGLSTCVTKDGQTTVTANLPMGGNKLTGLGAGTLGTDSARLSQVQGGVASLLGVSGIDTISGSGSPQVTSYVTGQMFWFVASGTNTGATTLNIDSLGAKNITRGTAALAAGDIVNGAVALVVYDGTQFQLLSIIRSIQTNGTIASAGTTNIGAANAEYLSVSGTTTITAFDAVVAGIYRVLQFQGALTLTHNGTSLILPGAANITTAAGDVAGFVSLGSGNWRCQWYQRASGAPVVNPAASETVQGIVELATEAEGLTGTDTSRAMTPAVTKAVNTRLQQNSQSADYTLTIDDAGKQIFHPSADTSARTFTIPANGTVAFAVGTAVTFINQNGAGVITIAITTDTMRLAGDGTTGSRTLAANGIATAVKVTSTEWLISGTGLT